MHLIKVMNSTNFCFETNIEHYFAEFDRDVSHILVESHPNDKQQDF